MAEENQSQTHYIIDELLEKAISNRASDLHLGCGLPPTIRVSGILRPLPGFANFNKEVILNLLGQILEENQLERLYENKEMDSSYEVEGKGRFRVNVFFERRNPAIALRYIPTKLPTLDELNISHLLYEFCKLPQGLVLVTGASGSGKSTTLAAMINWINHNRNSHIITIEDPTEFRFISNKSLIHQREIGIDTTSWHKALKSALREDADILLIGEIRDYETMTLAISAAEKGHLVLATLHTYSADQTIDHIVGMYPEHEQNQARMQIAAILEGTVTQTLVIGKDSKMRYPAIEIMIATNAIRNIIREGNSHFLYNSINTGYDLGMRTMERSLADLVNNGSVTLEEALSKSKRTKELERYIEYSNK